MIAADATSGLPVTFASTTPGICRAASNLVILLSAGTCSITASQGGNGSYAAATPVTRSFPVNLAKPSGTLTPAPGSPFAGGSESKSIAVGDFNGDGIQDLVVVNVGDSVAVLLGNGKGGFSLAPGSPITVETNAEFAAVGDFNGDGRQDLAVAHFGSGITVLLGDGSGGFAAAPGSPLASGPAYCVAVGDFNGDGIQDLAVPNLSGNNVSVLLGNAKGGFAAAPGSPFAVGSFPVFVAVGDFNGDGIQDLVTANQQGYNLTVLLGNGSGGFTSLPNHPPVPFPYSVAVGDFNGDGIQDLVTNSATVLLGDGRGGFITAIPGNPMSPSLFAAVGDFNGDGIEDIATANGNFPNVSILLGNGSGGFALAANSPIPVGATSQSVVVGDFNGDGIEDLVVATDGGANINVFLGGLAPTSSALSTTSQSTIPPAQAVQLNLSVSDQVATFGALGGVATFSDGATVLGASLQTSSPYIFNVFGLALGTHTLTGSYSGDARNSGSVSNAITIQVALLMQTITFGPLSNVALGAGPFTIGAAASSGLFVTLLSTTPGVCTVSGNTVTTLASGFCSITATQPGNSNYAAAIPVTQSFTVNPTFTAQTITFQPLSDESFGSPPFNYRGNGIFRSAGLVPFEDPGRLLDFVEQGLDSLCRYVLNYRNPVRQPELLGSGTGESELHNYAGLPDDLFRQDPQPDLRGFTVPGRGAYHFRPRSHLSFGLALRLQRHGRAGHAADRGHLLCYGQPAR